MSVTFAAYQVDDELWKPLWACTDKECKGWCDNCLKHEVNFSNEVLRRWPHRTRPRERGLCEMPAAPLGRAAQP